MKLNFWKKLLIALNVLGVICLIVLGAVYLSFDTTISNPDAMLPVMKYEAAASLLTLGALPLLIVNVVSFFTLKFSNRAAGIIFFIPSIVCLALVGHFWVSGLTSDKDTDNVLFTVTIDMATTDSTYALSADYGVSGDLSGRMFVTNADYSPITDSVSFLISPDDFSEEVTDFSDFSMVLSVCDDEDAARGANLDNHLNPAGEINISAEIGATYSYVLTGNASDGYALTSK